MKYARNRDLAVKLLNWLSSEEAQNQFADSNMEYPVNPRVKLNPQVLSWGEFKHNTDNIGQSGRNRATAIELMTRVAYR